ncbi:MAG: FAD-dependent oxidoreductase [Chloroflexota bacterium]|nr:FAD-dependent oxidoreductase [Chloroflexota bacterium]
MNEDKLARTIQGEIEEGTGEKPVVSVQDGVATLTGRFSSNQAAVDAGHIAGGFEQVRGVLNEIDYPGRRSPWSPAKASDELSAKEFDVVIVGGGVIGAAIARELSRFNLSMALVERHNDLGMDQTLHSNAMVHPAVVTDHGTLKWEMSYKGNPMWEQVAAELDVDFKRIGTLVVAEKPEEEKLLPFGIDMATKHNDPPPRLLDREELDEVEPGLAPHIKKGLYIWNSGIINAFELVVAYAENAVENGVQFFMDTCVTGVQTEDGSIRAVDTTRGTVKTRILVNAAGLYSDRIAEFAGDRFFTIHPRKGETLIFDKSYQPVRTVLATLGMMASRSKHSKGGGIIPTTDGNLQFGPTADEVCDREDVSTTSGGLDTLFDRFAPVLERVKPQYEKPDKSKVIAHFAGCRAATYKEEFIIEPSRKVKGLIHVAGIQSPGLASTPAIAARVAEIIAEEVKLAERPHFEPTRKRVKHFCQLDDRQKQELIQTNPLYGHIVCRCEQVSEGEIVGVLHQGIPANSIDAIKRRTRAGLGRCQGGFCMPRVLEIISREANMEKGSVTKKGGKSFILSHRTKRVER